MMNGAIVVVAGESSFAYFAAKLGLNVDVVLVQGKPLMGNPGNNDSIAGVVLAGCTALYWVWSAPLTSIDGWGISLQQIETLNLS